jgi:hypothetical protein
MQDLSKVDGPINMQHTIEANELTGNRHRRKKRAVASPR